MVPPGARELAHHPTTNHRPKSWWPGGLTTRPLPPVVTKTLSSVSILTMMETWIDSQITTRRPQTIVPSAAMPQRGASVGPYPAITHRIAADDVRIGTMHPTFNSKCWSKIAAATQPPRHGACDFPPFSSPPHGACGCSRFPRATLLHISCDGCPRDRAETWAEKWQRDSKSQRRKNRTTRPVGHLGSRLVSDQARKYDNVHTNGSDCGPHF